MGGSRIRAFIHFYRASLGLGNKVFLHPHPSHPPAGDVWILLAHCPLELKDCKAANSASQLRGIFQFIKHWLIVCWMEVTVLSIQGKAQLPLCFCKLTGVGGGRIRNINRDLLPGRVLANTEICTNCS